MTGRPIVFPDAVAAVITHLSAALAPTPVHRAVPGARPAVWLRVLRTGGVRATLVTDAAQVTIEAWANTAADATDLAQLARAHLNASVGTLSYRVDELGGPADLPDPASQQHRYTWSALVHLRGVAI